MLYLNRFYKPQTGLLFTLLSSLLLGACQTNTPRPQGEALTLESVRPEVINKYKQAISLMGAGEDAAALKVFAGVSRMNDRLSGPYVNRGLIFLRQGELDKSQQAFNAALQRNKLNPVAHNQLGIIMREKKDFASARRHYEAALQADGNYMNAHINLGILCDIYLQDKDCAMQHYQAYQQANAQDEQLKNWILDLQEQR